jgi:hypothetical protein
VGAVWWGTCSPAGPRDSAEGDTVAELIRPPNGCQREGQAGTKDTGGSECVTVRATPWHR